MYEQESNDYYQILDAPDEAPMPGTWRSKKARERLMIGTETSSDRNIISREAYDIHWNRPLEEDPEITQSENERFEKIMSSKTNESTTIRRYARLYRGTLRRIAKLQTKINNAPNGEVDFRWMDREGEDHVTTFGHNFIDMLGTMAYRMNRTLSQMGRDDLVDKIHQSTNIYLTVVGKPEIYYEIDKAGVIFDRRSQKSIDSEKKPWYDK